MKSYTDDLLNFNICADLKTKIACREEISHLDVS